MSIPRHCHAVLFAAFFLTFSVTAGAAQPALDRIVGPWYARVPLVIRGVTGMNIGALARAAGVPMGLEALSPEHTFNMNVQATGRTLRAVLDEVVASDARYEWREDDGVIVIRPVSAWGDATHILHRVIGPVKLEQAQANDALAAVADLFGAGPMRGSGPDDTSTFEVALPAGTLLDALNGIVRAHGTIAWAIAPLGHGSKRGSLGMSLLVGSSGVGFGFVPDAVTLRDLPAGRRPGPTRDVTLPVPDRIVGNLRSGQQVILRGMSDLAGLTEGAGVPIGLELLPLGERKVSLPEIAVTGLSLRAALSLVTEVDNRYEWREMDGVIVVRPKTAWANPENPLFRVVNNVRLEHVSMSEAVGTAIARLGSVGGQIHVSDTRRVSIDVPSGTVLDLLSAIARSHGALSWQFWEFAAADGRVGHILRFNFVGGWMAQFSIL